MEHAAVQPIATPFPWRAATVVAGAVAFVELIALIAIGLMHLAPHTAAPAAAQATATHARPVVHHSAPKAKPVAQAPLRPHSHVRVLVLNGNGVNGAAGAAAARLQAAGYPVAGAIDAQRHDYASSMVMFVPGWAKEARRLARETGTRIVAPVDGLRAAQLKGSKLILLLGR